MSYKTHSTYRGPTPDETRSPAFRRAALALALADCDAGRHRSTETDANTGNEVCRLCGTVVE